MSFRNLALASLRVNRANDRHGELENETAAIAWLFNNREQHMRNLAKDIVEKAEVYEPPLVAPDGAEYVVFDGNRRVTCLKLLGDPRRAPTTELQVYFGELRKKWPGKFPDRIQAQVETDRDRIDEILFRRHTGSQNGVGQSTWDDRMKSNFVGRTGKGSGVHVADEIEGRLARAGMWSGGKKLPRSNMNRLLSSEAYRNRLGFSLARGRFEFTHDEAVVLAALNRVAEDLASKKIVLGDIWDVDGKRHYLDGLDREGVLPTAAHVLDKAKPGGAAKPTPASTTPAAPPRPTPISRPVVQSTLIPQTDFAIAWPGRLQRHRAIWEELQFRLALSEHPNAISVLFRVLFELSVENYISETGLSTVDEKDTLVRRAVKVAEDLRANGKIDKKYLDTCKKLQQSEDIVSMDTLNRWVHSPNFNPSPEHLKAVWSTLSLFLVCCLNA